MDGWNVYKVSIYYTNVRKSSELLSSPPTHTHPNTHTHTHPHKGKLCSRLSYALVYSQMNQMNVQSRQSCTDILKWKIGRQNTVSYSSQGHPFFWWGWINKEYFLNRRHCLPNYSAKLYGHNNLQTDSILLIVLIWVHKKIGKSEQENNPHIWILGIQFSNLDNLGY